MLKNIILLIATLYLFSCERDVKKQNQTKDSTKPTIQLQKKDSLLITSEQSNQPLSIYKKYLDSLNKKDVNSIDAGITYFVDHYSNSTSNKKDSAIMIFIDFFIPTARGYSQYLPKRIQHPPLDNNTGRLVETKEFITLKNELSIKGISFVPVESYFVSIEAAGFLEKKFSDYASSSLKEFLSVLTILEKNAVDETSDAYFRDMIDLSRVVAGLSDFNLKYPTSIPMLKTEVNNYYSTFLKLFIFGNDDKIIFFKNSNSQDYLPPAGRKIYKEFIEKKSESDAGKIIKEYYTLLEKNNFILSNKIRNIISDKYLNKK